MILNANDIAMSFLCYLRVQKISHKYELISIEILLVSTVALLKELPRLGRQFPNPHILLPDKTKFHDLNYSQMLQNC